MANTPTELPNSISFLVGCGDEGTTECYRNRGGRTCSELTMDKGADTLADIQEASAANKEDRHYEGDGDKVGGAKDRPEGCAEDCRDVADDLADHPELTSDPAEDAADRPRKQWIFGDGWLNLNVLFGQLCPLF